MENSRPKKDRPQLWVLALLILNSVVTALYSTWGPTPAGYNPAWGLILLELFLVGSFCFIAVWLSRRGLTPENRAARRKGQRVYTSILILCAVAIVGTVAFLAYSYLFVMPQKLHGTWRQFTTADGLLSDIVNGVATDARGNVWFATTAGVSTLTAGGEWVSYRAADGLGADWASDVVADLQGRVWVATLGGGVRRFDGTGWRSFTTANSNLPDDFAVRLAVDGQGNVWVSSRSGLSFIHDDRVTYVDVEGALADAMAVDTDGDVWLATRASTLTEYDPHGRRWRAIPDIIARIARTAPADSWASIQDIAVDRQSNHLWLVTSAIVELAGDNVAVHQPAYKAAAVFIDTDGYKWFGVRRKYAGGVLILTPDGKTWWFYQNASLLQFSAHADYWLARNTDWKVSAKGVKEYWEAQREIDPSSDRKWFALLVELKAEGKVIGDVGIGVIKTADQRQGTIGWLLGRKYQGQGLATEAARAMLEFGFEQMGLRRITASTGADNLRSWQLMERLSMRREAHFRESDLVEGEWRDEFVYALLADEWRARQSQAAR